MDSFVCTWSELCLSKNLSVVSSQLKQIAHVYFIKWWCKLIDPNKLIMLHISLLNMLFHLTVGHACLKKMKQKIDSAKAE